jgi:hypothetical protein
MSASVPQSDAELIVHLRQQVDFLRASADRYDAGEYHEGVRLATSARVLCHDTPSSHALLQQLGLLDTIRFVDTNTMSDSPPVAESDDPDVVMIMMFSSGLAPMAGYPTGLVPRLGRDGRSTPKSFAEWWNAPILELPELEFSRKKMVLALANQDGGAHVDPSLGADYEALSRSHAAGTYSYTTNDGAPHVIEVNPAFPIMRQIAFELIETLAPIAAMSASDPR